MKNTVKLKCHITENNFWLAVKHERSIWDKQKMPAAFSFCSVSSFPFVEGFPSAGDIWWALREASCFSPCLVQGKIQGFCTFLSALRWQLKFSFPRKPELSFPNQPPPQKKTRKKKRSKFIFCENNSNTTSKRNFHLFNFLSAVNCTSNTGQNGSNVHECDSDSETAVRMTKTEIHDSYDKNRRCWSKKYWWVPTRGKCWEVRPERLGTDFQPFCGQTSCNPRSDLVWKCIMENKIRPMYSSEGLYGVLRNRPKPRKILFWTQPPNSPREKKTLLEGGPALWTCRGGVFSFEHFMSCFCLSFWKEDQR